MLQLIADSKFLQQESLVELVKAIVHAAGPLQRLSATPESIENAEVTPAAADDARQSDASSGAFRYDPQIVDAAA